MTQSVYLRILPTRLTKIKNPNLYGRLITAVGWGKVTGGTSPRFLQTTTLRVLTHTDCENRLRNMHAEDIQDNLICSVGDSFILMESVSINFI